MTINKTSLLDDKAGWQTLKNFYQNEVRSALVERFLYKNNHEIPTITKVVLNRTYSDRSNSKGFNRSITELGVISGQKPVVTRAKKSIATFGITKADNIGMKVTLRNKYMFSFLQRLINLTLPRIRDFQGLNPLSFDQQGNYTFGISEQLMFPEMNAESIDSPQGLHITIVTTAKSGEEGYFLLKELGLQFKDTNFWD